MTVQAEGRAAETIGEGPYLHFRHELVDAGLLYATAVDGIYGKSASYQNIVNGVHAAITDLGGGRFESVHFPPVLVRSTFDQTGYLNSFPNLMGSIHIFRGDDRAHAELMRRYASQGDWAEILEPAEVVLSSAACHPVYPLCRGRLPEGGRRFEIQGYCFRHEPSLDPARMQSFRMHELVYVGDAEAALAHRDQGLAGGLELLTNLGLDMEAVPANDPFFGRLGTILANTQLEDSLKIEGVTPICSTEKPTAIMSANYAQDHFGVPFSIETESGAIAHSSCVAFGVDRITLALLHEHGLIVEDWPLEVQARLWP
jgi:seryl-tRNA synthetase